MKQITSDESMDEALFPGGYAYNSDCQDVFSRLMGSFSSQIRGNASLKASLLNTPLGSVLVIADEKALYLLEFIDCRGLEREIECLQKKTQSAVIAGRSGPIHSIEDELRQYFNGTLREFKTPICFFGSPFQQQVWEELQKIPSGQTRSYSDIAANIGRPSACRAVAQANGANQLAIIVPCHRVINANGQLGGYAGGVSRKKWLLNHEQHNA